MTKKRFLLLYNRLMSEWRRLNAKGLHEEEVSFSIGRIHHLLSEFESLLGLSPKGRYLDEEYRMENIVVIADDTDYRGNI